MMIAALGLLVSCSDSDKKGSSGKRDRDSSYEDDRNDRDDDDDRNDRDDDDDDDSPFPEMSQITGTWLEQVGDEDEEPIELEIEDDATFTAYYPDGSQVWGDILVSEIEDEKHPFLFSFYRSDNVLWYEFRWEDVSVMDKLYDPSNRLTFFRSSDNGSDDDDDDNGYSDDDDDYDDDDDNGYSDDDDDNSYNDDDNHDDSDYEHGDEDEKFPEYGTYSYLPEGYLPHFDQIMVEDLYPDSESVKQMLDKVQRKYKEYLTEMNFDFGDLDTDALGSLPENYTGVYYRSGEDSTYYYDDKPLEGVESWLVFFKSGTWAIYDGSFSTIKDCGVLLASDDCSWRFYTLRQNGEFMSFFEFDTGIMTCELGAYTRVYEVWKY